jgi:hypothetical protein
MNQETKLNNGITQNIGTMAVASFAIGCTIGVAIFAFGDVDNVARILSNRLAGYGKDSIMPVVGYYVLNALVFLPMCCVFKNGLTYVNLAICWPALVLPVILIPALSYNGHTANGVQVLVRGPALIILAGSVVLWYIMLALSEKPKPS